MALEPGSAFSLMPNFRGLFEVVNSPIAGKLGGQRRRLEGIPLCPSSKAMLAPTVAKMVDGGEDHAHLRVELESFILSTGHRNYGRK